MRQSLKMFDSEQRASVISFLTDACPLHDILQKMDRLEHAQWLSFARRQGLNPRSKISPTIGI
jgi:hypothetical protein